MTSASLGTAVPADGPMATMRPSRMTIVALSIGAPPVPSITRAPRKAVVCAYASLDTPMTNANHAPIREQSRLIPLIMNPPTNDQVLPCSGLAEAITSYSRILVTEGIRRQRLELAI